MTKSTNTTIRYRAAKDEKAHGPHPAKIASHKTFIYHWEVLSAVISMPAPTALLRRPEKLAEVSAAPRTLDSKSISIEKHRALTENVQTTMREI